MDIHKSNEAKRYKEQLEDLGYMLGVYWQLDDLSKPVVHNIKIKQDKVMLPLAVSVALSGMNPKSFSKTIDDLKKKAYEHNKGMSSANDNANMLSKDEFINMFNEGFAKTKHNL